VDNSPVLSGDASNALDWFTPSTGAKAGRTLLGITDDAGGFVVYDPQDNTAVDSVLKMNAQAIDIQSIEKGPDGKLYIGGYQFGASVYDTDAKTILYNSPELDQPEGIGFLNGKVYFGTYGSARIYSYDPSKPFNYSSGSDGNPGLAYDIGNDQDRPFVLTSGDNKLFVGTVPDYGMLGGALTVYDEKTIKDFIAFSSYKGRNYKIRRRIFSYVWPVLMLLLLGQIVLAAVTDMVGELQGTLIPLFLLCLFAWVGMSYLLPSFLFNRSKKLLGIENTFVFCEDEFLLSSESPLFQGNSKMKYSAMHKVYETENYLYLFLTSAQAYLLDKSKIASETADELRGIISRQLPPEKYVVCKDVKNAKVSRNVPLTK
jgi:hypothetical protein